MSPAENLSSDVQIFVSEENGDPRILNFRASASDPRLGLGTFVDYGRTTLRVDPVRYLDGLFDQLQLAGEGAFARLEDAGVRLFEDLLPFELRRRLWRARTAIRTLFVVSAEAWIPWELLKLQDPESEAIGPFFAEAFEMGRWLSISAKSSASLHLPLRRIGMIVPGNSGLPAAKLEKRILADLAAAEREVVEIAAEKPEVVAAMAEGTYDGWHFCGHGNVAEGEIEPWYLQLENEAFDSNQLHGRARRLGLRNPLVFLNACHGARGGDTLAGVAGLPASFLQVGAGAFIGALWQVSDDGAVLFAQVFYRSFLNGATLGAAIRAARTEARQAFPDDPTWLAYIVLGHPAALCRAQEAAPAGDGDAGSAMAGKIAPAPVPAESVTRSSRVRAEPGNAQRRKIVAVAALLASLLGGGVAGLGYWRVPTSVRIEGRAAGLSVKLAAAGASLLDEAASFRRLSLTQLGALELASGTEETITRLDLGAGDFLTVTAPGTAGSRQGSLPRLRLAAGERLALQAEKLKGAVALRIEGTAAEPPYEVVLPLPFQLQGSRAPEPDLPSFERGRLRLFPGPEAMVLEADLPVESGEPRRRLLEKAIEVEDLAFTERRALDDSLRSTLKQLKVSYPDSPARAPVELGPDSVLVVAAEDLFRLTSLELDTEQGELFFAAEGRASELLAGTPGNLIDRRLTCLAVNTGEIAGILLALATLSAGAWGSRFFTFGKDGSRFGLERRPRNEIRML